MYATVIAKGVTDFANNCELLKYGLHLDAVISRWARDALRTRSVPSTLQKKKRYIQIYRKFYFLFINNPLDFHPAKLQLFLHSSKYLVTFSCQNHQKLSKTLTQNTDNKANTLSRYTQKFSDLENFYCHIGSRLYIFLSFGTRFVLSVVPIPNT